MKALKMAVLALGTLGVCVAGYAGKEIHRILNGKPNVSDSFLYTAHSGCENTADNSTEFLEKAIALGVPVLEVDVTVHNDGTPVLLHADCAGEDEGLLLDDAFRFIAEKSDSVQINLDLKAFSNIPRIAELAEQYNLTGRCFFTGVEADQTQTVKIDAPNIPYYLNMDLNKMRLEDEGYLRSAALEVQRCGAVGVNCQYRNASKKLIEIFHAEGLKVSLWTADNPLVMRNLLLLGPDNITTRRPILLASLLPQA